MKHASLSRTIVAFVAFLGVGATPGLAFAKKIVSIPIQHVIIIMQENRSFDHYFGTFPGAIGFRRGTCVPLNPNEPGLGCVKPFHDPHDINAGAAHGAEAAQVDLDDGVTTTKMDGFVYQQSIAKAKDCNPQHPNCGAWKDGIPRHDTVGYHTDEEIPNYWAYARHFVLQDQLFEGVRTWSWPSHLDLASEWSAACTDYSRVSTCATKPEPPKPASGTSLPWANLFQLLDVKGVSWKYYLGTGDEPDCEDDEMSCDPKIQAAGVASIWNPAPFFAWVKSQGHKYLLDHNPDVDQFLVDVKNGTLPSVSWIAPAQVYGEHPPAGITAGMEYVTSLVNAIMQSPYWQNTAIVIAHPPGLRAGRRGELTRVGLRVWRGAAEYESTHG